MQLRKCVERETCKVSQTPAIVDSSEQHLSHRSKNTFSGAQVSSIREPIFKRPFDLLLSGIGLLVSLPLWAFFVAWIWLEDGRPIFFQQWRIGKNGKLFRTLKFRSMVKDPARVEVQARRNDPRITRVGRILRKTALDELPQVWNIFVGDMSFVGPRSQPEKEIVRVGDTKKELYIRDVPGYDLRQLVRPGLTGIAQIYAPREVAHRYKFKYDLIYVRRMMRSAGILGDIRMFLYDLALILRSVWTTLRGRWEV
jgi:lipopolysaccharide/colanic/teichoic acid biosynthesis glycosyltransferase